MKKIAGLIVVLFIISCNSGTKSSNADNQGIKSEPIEITYKVEGMHCTNCENSIAKGVNELEGIEVVKANHIDSTTYVKYDPKKTTEDKIIEQIKKRGYEVKGEI